MSDRLRGLLLVVALLVGQFSLVLHQMDIEHHAAGKECTICLASHGLDHALAGAFLPPVPRVTSESPGVLPAILALFRTPVRLVARSPPVSSLHA